MAEVTSEDRSPAGDAQSSAAVEGVGWKGLGVGAMAGLGRGHLARTFRARLCARDVSWLGATSSAAGAWLD